MSNHEKRKSCITVQLAAEILGVSAETLRNWDRIGKLPAKRNKNGYRSYEISNLERFAKEQGLRRKQSQKHRLII